MKLKHIPQYYIPKGGIEGFPLEIIDKILEYSVEKGNTIESAIDALENKKIISQKSGLFDVVSTPEGAVFWCTILIYKNFSIFFELYPERLEKGSTLKAKKRMKDLISFGEYLLSKERAASLKATESEVPYKDRKRAVTDADIANWQNKQP